MVRGLLLDLYSMPQSKGDATIFRKKISFDVRANTLTPDMKKNTTTTKFGIQYWWEFKCFVQHQGRWIWIWLTHTRDLFLIIIDPISTTFFLFFWVISCLPNASILILLRFISAAHTVALLRLHVFFLNSF